MRFLVNALQRAVWGMLSGLLRTSRFLDLIDATGIVIFVGPNGSGKSLAAVMSCLRALDGETWTCAELSHRHNRPVRKHYEGCADCLERAHGDVCPVAVELLEVYGVGERLVYSTVHLLDADKRLHPRFVPLEDYRQLTTIEHADVLFDEVAGVSDSSDSGSVPVQVVQWLHTLRKADVRLRVTTPAYARCSLPIRQVAQLVVDARAFMPELAATGRRWRPRKAMMYVAYDAFAFKEYTPSTGTRLKAEARAALWRPGSRASMAYDTLSQVIALGHTTEAGMCSVCGGTRSKPRCGCGPEIDHAYHEGQTVVVTEKVTPSGARSRSAEVVELRPAEVVEAGVGRRKRQVEQ